MSSVILPIETAAAPAINESDLLLLKAERRAEIRYETRRSYRLCSPSPLRSALASGSGGPGWGIHEPRAPLSATVAGRSRGPSGETITQRPPLAAYGHASTVLWWANAFSRTATFPTQALSLESAYYTATIL